MPPGPIFDIKERLPAEFNVQVTEANVNTVHAMGFEKLFTRYCNIQQLALRRIIVKIVEISNYAVEETPSRYI